MVINFNPSRLILGPYERHKAFNNQELKETLQSDEDKTPN